MLQQPPPLQVCVCVCVINPHKRCFDVILNCNQSRPDVAAAWMADTDITAHTSVLGTALLGCKSQARSSSSRLQHGMLAICQAPNSQPHLTTPSLVQ